MNNGILSYLTVADVNFRELNNKKKETHCSYSFPLVKNGFCTK